MDDFIKKRRIRRITSEVEPHEVLMDKLARKRDREWGMPEQKMETPLVRRILNKFLVFSFIVLFLLLGRTFQLQILEGSDFLALANDNQYIFHMIQAERGVIYDRNLKQLVFNLPNFDLVCNKGGLPADEDQRKQLFSEIADVLAIDYDSVAAAIDNSKDREVIVSENLSHNSLIVLQTRIGEFPGFSIEQRMIREYQDGPTYSHIIGYTGKITREEFSSSSDRYSMFDYVGRMGLESYYEDTLRKNPGQVRVERDALGNVISQQVVSLPESGDSLVLWLDSDLQKKVKEELEKTLQSIGSRKAVGVALDPKTGGVLAMVSIPSFDNNLFSIGDNESIKELFENEEDPLFNRVISGVGFPTGSTIKPLVASAALQEGIVSPNQKINCTGLIEVTHEYDPSIIYQYHDWSVHGLTDIRKAIAESCNVFFYTLGGGYAPFGIKGLGPQKIEDYLGLFGWGQKTDIDLPGEGEGTIPVLDENWRKGDTYHLSIGQGPFAVTPLQVASAYAAIANGGKLLKPQVVKEVVDTSGGDVKVIGESRPEVIREGFIDPENLQVVREGMRQAVTGKNSPQASSILLSSLPVAAAAKTGTAETSRENIYHNWVSVFAPYDNPEIVLTIMIEDVEGVRAAVLPAARDILNWYFSR